MEKSWGPDEPFTILYDEENRLHVLPASLLEARRNCKADISAQCCLGVRVPCQNLALLALHSHYINLGLPNSTKLGRSRCEHSLGIQANKIQFFYCRNHVMHSDGVLGNQHVILLWAGASNVAAATRRETSNTEQHNMMIF